MFSIITSALKSILEMDHLDTRVEGNKTIYTFKTTSLIKSLVEPKSKILSVLDFPVDIPQDVSIKEVKRGRILKEFVVDITVPSRLAGKLRDLIAKKYPLIDLRRRKYSGEA